MPNPHASVISRGLHEPLLPPWLGKADLLADIRISLCTSPVYCFLFIGRELVTRHIKKL
jgi:hypothetical protein